MRLLLLAGGLLPGVMGADYKLMAHGNGACDEGSKFLTTWEECKAAAKKIKLKKWMGDKDPSILANVPNLPYGCFYKEKTEYLFFNPEGTKYGGDFPMSHQSICKVASDCTMNLSPPKNAEMGTCKKGAKMKHGDTCKFKCKDGFLPIGSQPECSLGEKWGSKKLDGEVVSTFECAYVGTCEKIRENHKNLAGVDLYAIDPDGKGPMKGYKAYCDMASAGGGFQLVMRRVHGHPAIGPTPLPMPNGGSGYLSDKTWLEVKPTSGQVLIKFLNKRLEGANINMLVADISQLKKANCRSWANATTLKQDRRKALFADGEKTCRGNSNKESFMFGPDANLANGNEVYFMDKSDTSLYKTVDGKKHSDLIAWSTAEMWVKDSNPPPPPPSSDSACIDMNTDGNTDAQDLMLLLGAYGLNDCELREYDLNGDCIVGSADLLQLLSDFGCQGKDCAGNEGGKAKKDKCGVCDGDGSSCSDCHGVAGGKAKKDCAGVCGGKATKDMCGKCDTDPKNDCEKDCTGKWGGSAKVDCAGKCQGKATKDKCGKCDTDPKNDCKQDCRGQWGGTLQKDCWGNCGGKAKKDKCGLCDDNPKNDCDPDADGTFVKPEVITMSSSVSSKHSTYRLSLKLLGKARSMYSLVGSAKGALVMPPAYQTPSFGVNIGGISAAVIKQVKAAAFDSWLTVGITGGDADNELASAGMDAAFKGWSDKKGFKITDGTVFWADPKRTRAKGSVVVAQLTVPNDMKKFHVEMGAVGKQIDGKDWRVNDIIMQIPPSSKSEQSKNIGGDYCDPVLITMSASKDSKSTTYRLAVKLKKTAASVYATVGAQKGHMLIPPAYHTPTFGVNIGGISKDIVKLVKAAEFDSWLTIGITDGDKDNAISNAGLSKDFKAWTDKKGINNKDCSVFWMNPKKTTATGQKTPIVLGQITVPSSFKGHARMGVVGHFANGKDGQHWRDNHIQWAFGK